MAGFNDSAATQGALSGAAAAAPSGNPYAIAGGAALGLLAGGFGGGNGNPATTTQQQIDPALAAAATQNITNAQAAATTPYNAATMDQTAAGFTADQVAAQQGIRSLTAPGQFGAATAGATGVLNSNFDAATAAGLMNPYTQNVTDVANRKAMENAGLAAQARQSEFANAGALGGSAQGIQEALAGRNLQQLMSDNTVQGQAAAYDAARGQFNTQNQTRLNAATNLSNIGTAQQTADINRLDTLAASGALQQTQNQNVANVARANAQAPTLWNQANANFMSGVLSADPRKLNSSSTQIGPRPDSGIALIAAGSALAGGLGKSGIWGSNTSSPTSMDKYNGKMDSSSASGGVPPIGYFQTGGIVRHQLSQLGA